MPKIADAVKDYIDRLCISLLLQPWLKRAGWIDYIFQALETDARMEGELSDYKEFLIQVHSDCEERLGGLE